MPDRAHPPSAYAIVERERRFLLATPPDGLGSGVLVEDLYLPGTGLRLRTMTGPGAEVVHKLGHKVREGGPGTVWHTSIYPDETEWRLLRSLGGVPLRKRRHLLSAEPAEVADPAGPTVAVDVFEGRHAGLVLAEVDRRDGPDLADLEERLRSIGLQVVREVTGEEAYTGGALAVDAGAVVPAGPPSSGGTAPGSGVTIRLLAEPDWPAVVAIVQGVAAAGESYALDHGIGTEPARAFWSEAAHVVVAEVDGRVLGSAKMGPNRPAQGSHVGTAAFMVAAAARGQGVGRALGEYAVAWHEQHGFRAVQFNAVVETNTVAVELWRGLGFRVIGTVPGAFRRPSGDYVGLHVMHLDLVRPDPSVRVVGIPGA